MRNRTKWLLVIGLAVAAGLFFTFCVVPWWEDRDPVNKKIDEVVKAEDDSTKVWRERFDSILKVSSQRDSSIRADSVEDLQAERQSRVLTQTIGALRQKLAADSTLRDSVASLVKLDTLHENRHRADSVSIFLARRQRDSLRVDRDDWKRAAGRLMAEKERVNRQLAYVRDLAKDRCKLLFVTTPCPVITVGPGTAVRTDPSLKLEARVVQVTVGFPFRFGKRHTTVARPTDVATAEH